MEQIEEALAHIRHYEQKYGVTLSEFEKKKLRALNSVQAHEDYTNWCFWNLMFARADYVRLFEIAKRAPQDKPITLDEIANEVHRHRQNKHVHS